MDQLPQNPTKLFKLRLEQESDPKTIALLDKLGRGMALIVSTIRDVRVQLPKIYTIEGKVKADISSLPPISINNYPDISKYFQAIDTRLSQLVKAISMIAVQEPIKMPELKIPKTDFTEVVEAINSIHLIDKQKPDSNMVDALGRIEAALIEIYNKPTMTPTPVTHVSLNSLNGAFKATKVTVGSSPTPLPNVQFINRRSLIIYNGSANTIYLGGPTVAVAGTGQGLPVPAGSASPAFDAGPNMVLYGIAASSSDVNIMEMADEASGR